MWVLIWTPKGFGFCSFSFWKSNKTSGLTKNIYIFFYFFEVANVSVLMAPVDMSVEWRVSYLVLLYLVCSWRAMCSQELYGSRVSDLFLCTRPLYCIAGGPVHFVLIFMKWTVCSVRGWRPADFVCVCVLCFSCVSVCACVLGICELLLISVFTKWPVVEGFISLVWCFLLLCVFSFCYLCLFFMYCFYSLMILKNIF